VQHHDIFHQHQDVIHSQETADMLCSTTAVATSDRPCWGAGTPQAICFVQWQSCTRVACLLNIEKAYQQLDYGIMFFENHFNFSNGDSMLM
jgi:hypothetical protein